MIYLHTLGDSLIKVGEKDIRPTSPLLFAALLYLGIERGRRVPRAALQEMLFPNADERSGAHSLRQLLYKLRQLGAPLEVTSTSVTIPASHVEDDVSTLNDRPFGPEHLGRVGEGFLPGYKSNASDGFERWLDDRRTEVSTAIRSRLVTELTRSRAVGDALAAQRIATTLLKLDPFNEEATLALAEVLALGGQKRGALRLLEDYVSEVGVECPTLRLPPEILRRRVFERIEVPQHRVPLIGRDDELAWLLAQFDRATAGKPTITVVWGDAGIGKTRLIREFATHLLLRKARTETAHCQPHDIERPLGALIDLVPKLLEARGALGVSPESMSYLRRLAGDVSADENRSILPAELMTARIREALSDLLQCVAAEGPLVMLIEDAHWLDQASLQLLFRTMPERAAPIHLVLTRRNRPLFTDGARLTDAVFVRQLEPLTASASAALFSVALGPECVAEETAREECLALGAGNPLFLCTIAEHLRLRGAAPPTQARIADLLKQRVRLLEASSLLFLRSVAALGNHGTPARIAACTGMTIRSELLALQDVADRGLVIRENGSVKCAHDLLGQVVLQDTPTPMRLALFERVASVLEEDGVAGKQVNLLWSCAESWRLAENPPRAVLVLKRCAAYALDVGQPMFACSALEKAQDLADETERFELVAESIRVADLALDSIAVLRNVARYRGLTRTWTLSPRVKLSCDLAEINALRRTGKPYWQFRQALRDCAFDTNALPSHRIKAARLFLHAAEQHWAATEAIEFFSTLDNLNQSKEVAPDWIHLHMIYHCSFGDMSEARTDAAALLEMTTTKEDVVKSALLGNIGIVLLRGGATCEALDVFHETVHLAERLGNHWCLTAECVRLSDAYLRLNDTQSSQVWLDRAEHYWQQHSGEYLGILGSTRIELALLRGDHITARRELNCFRTQYGDMTAQYVVRAYTGLDIWTRKLEGSLSPSAAELKEFETLNHLGRTFCDHEAFAYAFWLALDAGGKSDIASQRLEDYVGTWRRELYALPSYLHEASVRSRSKRRANDPARAAGI